VWAGPGPRRCGNSRKDFRAVRMQWTPWPVDPRFPTTLLALPVFLVLSRQAFSPQGLGRCSTLCPEQAKLGSHLPQERTSPRSAQASPAQGKLPGYFILNGHPHTP
jgi:hypothetical protein